MALFGNGENKTALKRLLATSVRETERFGDNGNTTLVQYHDTVVVRFDNKTVFLQTGGWFTATTKNRMNQASREFDLGYHVYQKGGRWFVEYKDETIEWLVTDKVIIVTR